MLGEDPLAIDRNVENAFASPYDPAVDPELLLDFRRQTGGSWQVVSNAAIVNSNLHIQFAKSQCLHQNRRDVIQSAALVGRVDQLLTGGLQIVFVVGHHSEDFVLGNHAGEAVGAKKIDVAG